MQPSVHFSPLAALAFFALGATVAVLGAAAPAWEAARAQPALALKSGSEDSALSKLASPWPALACLALGALFTQLPPLADLPLFGFMAVALLLIGGIALMPRLAAGLFSLTGRWQTNNAVLSLTLARLANAPNQASIALGGVLSSFSLMVAMAIMVASFRVSVDDWLTQVLPAELYVRSATAGDSGGLQPDEQQAIRSANGIARADFLRQSKLTLAADRPDVVLLARPIDVDAPNKIVPIIGASIVPAAAMPVWVSEAMVDLYGYAMGQRVSLPLGGRGGKGHDFVVAGIWRDYVRQSGALQIRLSDYRAITGDLSANDAALWLQPGVTPAQASATLKRLPFGGALEFAEPGEIRAISLKIFDRSFAVTYLLEADRDRDRPVRRGGDFLRADAGARQGIRHAAPHRRHAPADPGDPGGRRRLADRDRDCGRLRAGLADQPDPGVHRQSAIVPLEHAAAHAVALAGGGRRACCWCRPH